MPELTKEQKELEAKKKAEAKKTQEKKYEVEVLRVLALISYELSRIATSLEVVSSANAVKAKQATKEIAPATWNKTEAGYTNGRSTLPLDTAKEVLLENGVPQELIGGKE